MLARRYVGLGLLIWRPRVDPPLPPSRPEVSREREAVRVGDLVKAKEITRDQVLAAVATIFDGRTVVPVSDAYALVLLTCLR